jgi:RNA polymerase sigma-70 factor (ECF subfamily)
LNIPEFAGYIFTVNVSGRTMAAIDDVELIKECQTGSETAFQKLVETFYQDAYRMAYYWTRNREVALDISQEAFIRVYRNLDHFDIEKPFRAWFYTIIKNLSMNYLKRTRSRRTVFSDFFSKKRNLPEAITETNRKIEQDETARVIWHSIRKLSRDEQEIILLREFEDFTYQEVSDLLNIPLGTVMSRLYHARKKLAKIIEGEQDES